VLFPKSTIRTIQIKQHLEGSVELIVRTLRIHFILHGVQAVITNCNLHILLTTKFDIYIYIKKKTDWTSGCSHDKKTPMAPLTVSVNMIYKMANVLQCVLELKHHHKTHTWATVHTVISSHVLQMSQMNLHHKRMTQNFFETCD
jgi:hypothetical protein